MPEWASLYVSGLDDQEYCGGKCNFWDNVYGYTMPKMKEQFYSESCFDFVDKSLIITDKARLHTVNIMNVQLDRMNFITEYKLKVNKKGTLSAIALWIEVGFANVHMPFKVSYSPMEERSSYYQVFLYLKKWAQVNEGDKLSGTIAVKKDTVGGKDLILAKASFHCKNGFDLIQYLEFLSFFNSASPICSIR